MPDEESKQAADAETLPDTPLHAYGGDREEDVEGDVEKLKSGDPEESQRKEIDDGEGESQSPIPPPKDY
jgi:hypothetical protein